MQRLLAALVTLELDAATTLSTRVRLEVKNGSGAIRDIIFTHHVSILRTWIALAGHLYCSMLHTQIVPRSSGPLALQFEVRKDFPFQFSLSGISPASQQLQVGKLTIA